VSCLLSLYRHAPFLTAHAPVGYPSYLAVVTTTTQQFVKAVFALALRAPANTALQVTLIDPLPPDLRAY
jgi:hypothetical protein